MSEAPTSSTPCAAYAEDVQEDTQTTIPGTKQSAQVKSKKSKRDAASDSGYGSTRTTATNGSQSTSGSSKLMSFMGRISGGAKKSKESAEAHPPRTSSKNATAQKKDSLRVDTKLETREDAARMKLSGEPVQRTPSNRSYETSPQLPRSARPSPPFAQAPPLRRPVPTSRAGLSRPVSYHAGVAGYGPSYQNISFSPSMSIPVYPQTVQPTPQHYQQPQITPVSSISPTMTLPRHAAYPFEPTLPAHYFQSSAGWGPGHQAPLIQPHLPHPSLPRRYSITGPPTHAIVEYPMVPARTVSRHPPPSYRMSSFSPTIADKNFYPDNNETYYRRIAEEEARQRMPPPQQRPLIRHASTTSAVRRSNRDSREYAPRAGTSSRAESFSSSKEENRVPLTIREQNISMHAQESPSSPKQLRRTRPLSYHAGFDSEIAAEQYQARQRGSIEPPSLQIHDVEKVKKSSKGHKSKASDSGSRSSDSKKETSTKKRPESRQKPNGDGLSVEVVEGCTATLRRNSKGYVVRVSLNEETKNRNTRTLEREDTRDSRRYSASGRRESASEATTRPVTSRRPSSSHPTARRIRNDNTDDESINKKLTERYKMTDDTAVEDEEYSEVDLRKKRSEKHEKLTAQRLHRLKSSSESRQSSRSARSNKSNKSNKSVPSSKNSVRVEGKTV